MPRAWTDSVVQPEQWKGGMRFGVWNVRSGSRTKAARELARYKLDLGNCRRLGGGPGKTRALYFSVEKQNKIT